MARQVNRSIISASASISLSFVLAACGGTGASPSPTAAPTATSTAAPATASPPPTAAASPTPGAAIRIALSGAGPIGLDVANDHAWVGLVDSGHVSEVDLGTSSEQRSIEVGFGVSHVAIGENAVYASRIDAGGGDPFVIIDPVTGDTSGLPLGPLESVSVEGETVWALAKDGTIHIIDAVSNEVRGTASVHLDADAHSEAVPGDGALWVSGDRTPVHRIDPTTASVGPDIETGGGIPLAFDGGLVWGARADEVWAIETATSAVARRVPLSDLAEILAMDVDGDDAWIAARKAGRVGVVVEFDLGSGQVTREFAVSLPAGVIIDRTRVWVTSYDTNELLGFER